MGAGWAAPTARCAMGTGWAAPTARCAMGTGWAAPTARRAMGAGGAAPAARCARRAGWAAPGGGQAVTVGDAVTGSAAASVCPSVTGDEITGGRNARASAVQPDPESWLSARAERPQEEGQVGGTLRQPPHEVSVPLVAVGHVD